MKYTIQISATDWQELEKQEKEQKAKIIMSDRADYLANELVNFLETVPKDIRQSALHLLAVRCRLNYWGKELK